MSFTALDVDHIAWEKSYYEEGKEAITKIIENPKNWDKWIGSERKYCLVSRVYVISDNVGHMRGGNVTDYLDFRVYSDIKENLISLFKSPVFRHYETPSQHFIVDMKSKKVVQFLSVCV